MNKVEKIKAEIERMKSSLPWGSCASQISMECNCKNEAYNEVLSYIDSLEEDPVSNDLEEASRNYADNEECGYNVYFTIKTAFKAGAQWQKKQLIAKACEWLLKNDSYAKPTEVLVRDFKKAVEE